MPVGAVEGECEGEVERLVAKGEYGFEAEPEEYIPSAITPPSALLWLAVLDPVFPAFWIPFKGLGALLEDAGDDTWTVSALATVLMQKVPTKKIESKIDRIFLDMFLLHGLSAYRAK
ncbi:MAG: hypothetical protein IKS61_02385 [Aeriscardovia sp.]|nr:hypothetical protein [Aeriscardovia sp.]